MNKRNLLSLLFLLVACLLITEKTCLRLNQTDMVRRILEGTDGETTSDGEDGEFGIKHINFVPFYLNLYWLSF